jgi:hypothetical protein
MAHIDGPPGACGNLPMRLVSVCSNSASPPSGAVIGKACSCCPTCVKMLGDQGPPGDSLQPEAIGAVMEVTKWLKPSNSGHDLVTARVCRLQREVECAQWLVHQ